MKFDTVSTVWANLEEDAKIIILTEFDTDRFELAEKIKHDNQSFVSKIELFDISSEDYEKHIRTLSENDLLIVMLTTKGFMEKGYRNAFSPFDKPNNLKCKYIFVRLDIPERALLTGLNTNLRKVKKIIFDLKSLTSSRTVRVTTEKGTDITMRIKDADHENVLYHARNSGGNAFLPPTEVFEDIYDDSANGIIVVDVTVGEFRINGKLIDELGIVDKPVVIKVENGKVKDVSGGTIAERLKKCFLLLPDKHHVCR